jgi:hypothetical protein
MLTLFSRHRDVAETMYSDSVRGFNRCRSWCGVGHGTLRLSWGIIIVIIAIWERSIRKTFVEDDIPGIKKCAGD